MSVKSSQQKGAGRSLWRRPLRATLALVTAAGLALGGVVLGSTAATAAPGDPIDMPDDNLRAYMNGRIATETGIARAPDQVITESEAESYTGVVNLDPTDPNLPGDVVNLAGLEWFTNINDFYAADQSFSDLTPVIISGVSRVDLWSTGVSSIPASNSLEMLTLGRNAQLLEVNLSDFPNLFSFGIGGDTVPPAIVGTPPATLTQFGWAGTDFNLSFVGRMPLTASDVAWLSGPSDLTDVSISHTELSDVSTLAGIGNVNAVFAMNRILDLSPLPDGITLIDYGMPVYDRANGQEATVASVAVGTAFANPVKDIDGTAVPVTSTDAGFSFDALANTWSWDPATTTPGVKTLTFANDPTDPSFSGTITQTVTEGAITPGSPAITGTPRFGETLTATPGTWSPADAALTYEWLVNGTVVTGETGTTFTPRAEDVGKEVTVRVTATKPGYTTATATSNPVTVAPAAIVPPTAGPSVFGLPQVGQSLTVQPGNWQPTDVTLGYQWHVDGMPVSGATGTTFTPGPEHAGKDVTVRVTASKPGYAPETAASGPVTIAVPQIASDKVQAKVGEKVTFIGANFGPGEDVQLVLHSSPVTLGTVKADQNGAFSTTIVLPSGATAGDHSVVATGADTKLSASVAFRVLVAPGSGSGSGSLQQTGATPSYVLMTATAALLLVGLGLGGAQLVAKRRVG